MGFPKGRGHCAAAAARPFGRWRPLHGVVIPRRRNKIYLYKDAYDEGQRIIRISDETRNSLEKVEKEPDTEADGNDSAGKLTSSKLAQNLGMKTNELLSQLAQQGYFEAREGKAYLTAKGKEAGGESKVSKRFGPYFIWPDTMNLG